MTQPTEEQEHTIALLITAAGNADAVRLASLVHNATTSGGVVTFTRPYLVDAWTERWRHHTQMPGRYRPEQRVNRNLPVLIGVTAVTGVEGPDLKVLDADVCQFLADRVYMAEALDAQHPTSNTLPVGEETRAAAAAVVLGIVEEPPPEEEPPPAEEEPPPAEEPPPGGEPPVGPLAAGTGALAATASTQPAVTPATPAQPAVTPATPATGKREGAR